MRTWALVLALLGVLASASWAHLCNNIYKTPDRIIVKPEKPSLILETGEQVRVFVRNNFPTWLRNVQLVVETDDPAVTVTVTPSSMEELIPGQKEVFTVQLKAGPGAREGRHQLTLSVGANEVGFRKLIDPTPDELKEYYNQGNPSSWLLVAESLAKLGDAEGVSRLVDEYFSGNQGRGYAIRAIRAAGRTGNEDLVPALAELAGNRDGGVKGAALVALGMMKQYLDDIRPIIRDQDPFVCCSAATALIIAEDSPEGLPEELTGFLTHEDAWVRVMAAWGCAYAGNEDALPVLADALKSGDADLIVFAGDALCSLAAQQEKKEAEEATAPRTDIEIASSGVQAMEGIPADRFSFNLASPLPTASGGGELGVQLYHTYPAPVHDVVVTLTTPDGEVKSQVVPEIRPTELRTVAVSLPAMAAAAGTSQFAATLSCRELSQPVPFTVALPGAEGDRASVVAASALPVGELEFVIRRFGDYYGYAWGVPLVLVLGALGLLAFRRGRVASSFKA